MPRFDIEELRPLGEGILTAAGATEQEARVTVDHCLYAHLTGEDNHGMEQVVWYTDWIAKGLLKPAQAITVERESETTLLVNGNLNFGHHVSDWTMQRLIEKADRFNVAAASIRYQTHVGRLIDYTAMAARQGMIALMMCDGAWGPKWVAPTGGRERRLGVNPWSIALPSDMGGTVGFDMTTGAVSGTKIWRAKAEGRPIPEGWIIDAAGNDTTDPNDLDRGGAMLPMGGPQAYKGYALNFMIEALGDILSSMEYREDPQRPYAVIDGAFMAVFKVEAFRPLVEWNRELRGFIEWVKSSEPAAGSDGVMYPGERSYRTTRERREQGVVIPDDVWERIAACAGRQGVAELIPEPWAKDDRR
jgi:LDH2 family malate/lactate/ureidoglycolate dehydrogenase